MATLFGPARDFEVLDTNLQAALRFFGEATEKGEVGNLAGAWAIYCGLNYGVFNIGLLSAGCHSAEELEERVADCDRYFSPRSSRWSFWLCDHWLEFPKSKARQPFANRQMRLIAQAPGMLANGLRPVERALPKIDCRAVTDDATRRDFAAVTGACFNIPYEVCQSVYRGERAWDGEYKGFVGYREGRPVAMMATVAAGGVLGIYSLATLPEDRRQGYGEALVRTVIEREQERTGLARLGLQSTEAGYRLYRRLGFQDVTRYSIYLTM